MDGALQDALDELRAADAGVHPRPTPLSEATHAQTTARARRQAGLVAALPALAQAAVAWAAPAGAKGLFQADLAALVLIVALGAFAVRARALGFVLVPAAALLAAAVHALVSGGAAGAFELVLLGLGVGAAASGLAALGRAIGTPSLVAGTLAAAVLWTAMCGLFWADAVAETLPYGRRHAFRQAVLHADAATACAYGVADFDRLHDPDVYATVDLATSILDRPRPLETGGAWFAVGLLAWGAAVLVGVDRPSASSA